MNKSQFFHKPTTDEIKKGKTAIEADDHLLEITEELENDNKHFLRIKTELYLFKKPKKFVRHGEELKINIPKRLWQHVNQGMPPAYYRLEAMREIQHTYYSSYSYKPIKENDKIKRKVSLVNCVDGAKLFAYIVKYSSGFEFETFGDSKRVRKDGAQILVKMPSRTSHKSNYGFKFVSVPIIKDNNKYSIAYSLKTEGHNCKDKLITNISFNYEKDKEDSSFIHFCDHEVAAYLGLIDYFYNKKENSLPLEMCLFAIPTNRAVKLNKTLLNKVVIERENEKGELQDYSLTEADRETYFWDLARKGAMESFYRKKSIDGLLKDAFD